ncbi:MAG: alpha-L-fucosidase [Armatimonadota bacterium]|nr:alpha-L-fucosidase [Armatimonadota bacterium]
MLIALAACMTFGMQEPQLPIKATTPFAQETREQKDARMQWWREARLGMFIHWGLYSIPAGEWMGSDGHGEWIRDTANIPLEAYNRFLPHFNPYRFDAAKWVKMAKDAGMKYIVITSKHHDGFALFDSKVSDFDIMATPLKRDIIKELADECKKQGIVFSLYHSIMDWHHPDYLPRRPWEIEQRPMGVAEMDRYVAYLHAQVRELLTKYGPIGIMWFDGEWESTWNHRYGQALYNLCRTLQPNTIVNNRVDVGRGGMGGMSDAGFAGDYGTPEQEIPATGLAGVDWETCMTMNAHWGFNRNDSNYKSTRELIRNLVDIASKGGNYLLNVGPTSEGEIPKESVERLKNIGEWMKSYGDSIYGSSASSFEKLPWGRCTVKRKGERAMLFLHVFDWPADGKLTVPGLGSDPLRAFLLQNGSALKVERDGASVVIRVPKKSPHNDVSVIGMEFLGEPVVFNTPKFATRTSIFVTDYNVPIEAGKGIDVRFTLDGSRPTADSPLASSGIHLSGSALVTLQGFSKARPVTEVVSRKFDKVEPWPAAAGGGVAEKGLRVLTYGGTWDKLPNFAALEPTSAFAMSKPAIDEMLDRENFAAVFEGYVLVPAANVYIFELTSDDGSKLLIDGKIVIDHDGLHSPEAKNGEAPLAAGLHRIRIEWFNKTGGTALRLRWAELGSSEFADLPADSLMHSTRR